MSTSSGPLFKKKSAGRRDVRPRAGGGDDAGNGHFEHSGSSSVARTRGSHSDDEEASSSVVMKKRKFGASAGKPLLQGTFSLRAGRSREQDDDEENTDRDDYAAVSGLGESDFLRDQNVSDARADATRTTDWYDDDGKKQPSSAQKSAATNDDGVYRGTANYNKFMVERDDGMSSKVKAATKGPVKASSNVRTITMVDYQPDVCKDYKETGYCGFGDTCKFLHDRSDYLAGWQLDSLSNGGRRREALLDDEEGGIDEEEDDIPFACLICRQPFSDPIVTKCGHFFCSSCAIKRFSKTSKCFACGKQTQGIFNSAQKILDRMEKIRALKQEEREEKRWDREDERDQAQDQAEGQLLEGVEIGEEEGGE